LNIKLNTKLKGKNMKTNYCTKRRILPWVALLLAQAVWVSAYAADTDENRGQLSAADYKFAREAARGGIYEVNLGNMAAVNSRNSAVQQFGQRMARDHGKAGQDLAQIVSRKGGSLPSDPSSKQQREVDRLQKLSGHEFDRAYMAEMVRCHKADEKAFKKASEEVQDPDLKSFAATTLTTVRDHLKMAQELDENVGRELSQNP
jgi:putative membrane protein